VGKGHGAYEALFRRSRLVVKNQDTKPFYGSRMSPAHSWYHSFAISNTSPHAQPHTKASYAFLAVSHALTAFSQDMISLGIFLAHRSGAPWPLRSWDWKEAAAAFMKKKYWNFFICEGSGERRTPGEDIMAAGDVFKEQEDHARG